MPITHLFTWAFQRNMATPNKGRTCGATPTMHAINGDMAMPNEIAHLVKTIVVSMHWGRWHGSTMVFPQ